MDTLALICDIKANIAACIDVADTGDLRELHTLVMTILDRHDVLPMDDDSADQPQRET